MRGSWHIVAIATFIAILSVMLDTNLVLLLLLWLFYLYFSERIHLLVLLTSFCFYIFFLYHLPPPNYEVPIPSDENTSRVVHGEIVQAPIITEKRVELIIETTNKNKLSVVFFQNEADINYERTTTFKVGATCTVNGKIDFPESARNPGQFDFANYLMSNGIEGQYRIKDLQDVSCTGSSFVGELHHFRQTLITQAESKLSPYTASWLTALVLGDKSTMPDDIIELFQRWGLSHLLAISGLHVAIVIGVVYFVLLKLSLLTKEKAEWIMLLFLPLYAFLAGADPPVLRASMMAMLIILARRWKIQFPTLDIISIVFILLLIANPFMIYQIGFQFSFIVAFSIILSRKWLVSTSSRFFQALIISFISQMIILPLQLQYFHLLQPLSILLNLIIIPYFSIFVIPLLFFVLLLSFLPEAIIQMVDTFFVRIHTFVIQGIQWVDHVFHTPFVLGQLPTWLIIVYYILLFFALIVLEKKRLIQAFIGFTCSILVLFSFAAVPYFSPKGYVTMLDIGQGDAFIIELPYRKGVLMIDAGARFNFEDMKATNSVYKQIIKPYLFSRGIAEIDTLFITHEDLDHDGSVSFMIHDRIVKSIVTSPYYKPSDEIIAATLAHGVPIFQVEAGMDLKFNGQRITVLGPLEDQNAANENSLVLYTEIGGRHWLFTGDITVAEEKQLMKQYHLQADILKVAHHGSNTSTDAEFLNKLNPRYALISVGKNNRYGHPTAEVIERLNEQGMIILRSDVHGAVQYQFVENKAGEFSVYHFPE